MVEKPGGWRSHIRVRQEIVALIFHLFSENLVCFFPSLAAALAIQVGDVLAVFERWWKRMVVGCSCLKTVVHFTGTVHCSVSWTEAEILQRWGRTALKGDSGLSESFLKYCTLRGSVSFTLRNSSILLCVEAWGGHGILNIQVFLVNTLRALV